MLLKEWQKYDHKVRDLEGFSKEEVIPYEKDAAKVAWARLTAEGFVSLAIESKEQKTEISVVLAGMISNLVKNRREGGTKDVFESGKYIARK